MQPQVGVRGIGRRLVQVGGHAHLPADPHPPDRIDPLAGRVLISRTTGTGRPQPRIGIPVAERRPGLRDGGDRDSPC